MSEQTYNSAFRYYYWGPLLLKFDLPKEEIDILLNDSYDIVDKKNLMHERLAGNINGEYQFTDQHREKHIDFLEKYFRDYITFKTHEWLPNVGPKFDRQQYIEYDYESSWVNFQKRNEYNPIHSHAGHLSYVIYLQIPEEIKKEKKIRNTIPPGSIQFIYTIPPTTLTDRDKDFNVPIDSMNWMPSTGEMFVFPSYLRHQVEAFNSDVTRISTSGNLFVKWKHS